MAWSPAASASSASARRSSMLRGFCWSCQPNIVSWPRARRAGRRPRAAARPSGPSASRASARCAAAPAQRDRGPQHVADRHAALQAAAPPRAPPPGRARRSDFDNSADRLQHVEQHKTGDEVGGEAGEPLDLAAAHAAVDLLGRRQQAERAAQHVLADQRRRSRQARRQRDAPVVERAVDRRMAEGDQADGAAGPRRELALAQAHQRVEAAPRQSLDAADEKERLTGEGHGCLLPARRFARRGFLARLRLALRPPWRRALRPASCWARAAGARRLRRPRPPGSSSARP